MRHESRTMKYIGNLEIYCLYTKDLSGTPLFSIETPIRKTPQHIFHLSPFFSLTDQIDVARRPVLNCS